MCSSSVAPCFARTLRETGVMKQLVALVDCNNFYVSCERLFTVALRNQPVIVLSNNDGCVVARSNDVKKLNIKMGTPFFQIRHLVEQHGIQVFSSNYALYADVSNRVMHASLTFHCSLRSIE